MKTKLEKQKDKIKKQIVKNISIALFWVRKDFELAIQKQTK